MTTMAWLENSLSMSEKNFQSASVAVENDRWPVVLISSDTHDIVFLKIRAYLNPNYRLGGFSRI